jgi:uncharacterized Fe-S cluster-containing radical SAM superfamily protein
MSAFDSDYGERGAVVPGKPDIVNWAEITLTHRCNQRCFFCYEDGRDVAREPDLDSVKHILEETRKRADQAVLCGKEVLLRRDILDIVSYGASLGLRMVVFTNGQALARKGLVEQLVEAGCSSLAISFHFPDAEAFAQCSRTSPKGFARQLAGIARVGEYNRQHRNKPLSVSTETDMFSLNLGRLSEMRRHLMDGFGGSPWSMRVASLLPAQVYDIGIPDVMEPMELRRQELAEFIATHPADVPLHFVKTAFCLLPETEYHRVLDLEYVYRSTDLTFNHEEIGQVTSDRLTVSGDRNVEGILKDHPYRMVCRTCRLTPICRFERVSWFFPAFAPRWVDRPIPVTSVGIADVLARLGPDPGGAARMEKVRDRLLAQPFPEEVLLRALSSPIAGEPVLKEFWADRDPFLVLRFAHEGFEVDLHLGWPSPQRGDGGVAAGYLWVRDVSRNLVPARIVDACMATLRGAMPPERDAWKGTWHFDEAASSAPEGIRSEDSGPRQVHLSVSEKDSQGTLWTFKVASSEEGKPCYRRVGDLMMWYNGGTDDSVAFGSWTSVVVAIMSNLARVPWSKEVVQRWEFAVPYLLKRAGLEGCYDWQVTWTGEG